MLPDLSLLAPAKLNLFLHILGREPNGYHRLQTLFQLLDYGDRLDFTVIPGNNIQLTGDIKGLDPQDNLIFRAARSLQEYANVRRGIRISCNKVLPMGAGLGGGSSNAATTLLALNTLWELDLPFSKLAKIGEKLGADVPVFVLGKTAWAEGTGEQLTPVEMPESWFLIITPDCMISTAEIFHHPDLTRDTHPIKIRAFLEQGGSNDCQTVAEKLFPEVREARQWLEQFGPARMTGTGSSVFVEFSTEMDCRQAYNTVPTHWQSFMAKGVNRSPTLQQLKAG